QHRDRQPQPAAGGRGLDGHRRLRRRLRPPAAGEHPGRLRLRGAGRGPRAAAPVRPLPRPRADDADPRAVGNDPTMDPDLRAFYEYHAALQEPWDGPAAVVFTDGTQVGARLVRNGLRPLRYWVTEDDLIVLGSETGLVDVPRSTVVRTGRVAPGEIFLLDLERGEILPSREVTRAVAAEHPYRTWVQEQKVSLAELPER